MITCKYYLNKIWNDGIYTKIMQLKKLNVNETSKALQYKQDTKMITFVQNT